VAGPTAIPAISAITSDRLIQGGLLARVMAKRGVSHLGEMGIIRASSGKWHRAM